MVYWEYCSFTAGFKIKSTREKKHKKNTNRKIKKYTKHTKRMKSTLVETFGHKRLLKCLIISQTVHNKIVAEFPRN